MDGIDNILHQFSLREWIPAGALFLCFLIQLFFYLFFFKRPYDYQKKKKGEGLSDRDETLPGISVIVTSKNNAKELERNLPFILEQDYPDFEVIVVNRGATDDTDKVLKNASQTFSRLYHTYISSETGNVDEKKLALTMGIKASRYDFLLFTEAYCRPCSNQWIKEYGKEFSQGKEVLLGFNRLEIPDKTALGSFMRYDNLIHHLKFLSMTILHKPFMGIGRNMAYKKDLFFKHKGYFPILNREGGEDDLYINRIASPETTGVVLSQESLTETGCIRHFSEWKALKAGYLYSKQFYKGFSSRIFHLETLSKYVFYLSLVYSVTLGLITGNYLLAAFALLLFVIRSGVQQRVMELNNRLFHTGKFHINLLIYDILQPINNIRLKQYASKRYKMRGYAPLQSRRD